MALQLSFKDSEKQLNLNDLFGLPKVNINKFFGLTSLDFKNIGLNPLELPVNSVALGPVGGALDVFSKISGYDVGLFGTGRFLKAGLQFDANFDLGGIKLDFPWANAGGLGLRLDGNNLVVNSPFNFQPSSNLIDIIKPSLNLYAGFVAEAGGKLDFKLGQKNYNFVPDKNFKFPLYEILNFSSKPKTENSQSGTDELKEDDADRSKSFFDGALETNFEYPTFDKLKTILKPSFTSQGITLGGSIPLFSIQANLVKLIGNYFPLAKILSAEKDFGAFKVDWELLEASVGGGINLDLEAKINFGNPVAWLQFEDKSIEKINLNSSNINILNVLPRLDSNNDGKANIEIKLGFDEPRLQGKAGLSANIFGEPTVGKASVTVDGLGTKTIGPLYGGRPEDRFNIAKYPLPFLGGSFTKNLPASLAPTVTFKVGLPINELSSSEVKSLPPLEQIDGFAPVLKLNPLTGSKEIENDSQFIEQQSKIFLARKADSDNYVFYKSSELRPPEASDPINPYLREDLVNNAFVFRDSQKNIITHLKPYLVGNNIYRPIGAELDSSDPSGKKYQIIFRIDGFTPFTKEAVPFFEFSGAEEITSDGQRYINLDTGSSLSTNKAAFYERILDQDLNSTGFLEPGELINGNILGTGLWKNDEGKYWIGDHKATPTTYLSDPLLPPNSPLPGEAVGFIYPQDNFINPKYKAVLFQNGSEFQVWNVNEANEKVSEEPYLKKPLDVDDFKLGHFERLLNKDFNNDGQIGITRIIDGDVDKNEYTLLFESIKPTLDNNNQISLYDASYVVRNDDIKVTVSKGTSPTFPFLPFIEQKTANIFLKNPFKQQLGSSFSPSFEYIGRFQGGIDFIQFGWASIAAAINTKLSTPELPILDVMWKNVYEKNAINPRWFLWRFEVQLPSPDTISSIDISAVAADRTENNKAEYLNNSNEVAVYENQFDEDFNQDGFLGKTTKIEQSGDTLIVLVEGDDGWRYEIKDTSDARGTKLPVYNDAYNIPYNPTSIFDSTWKPIAVERISNTFALEELTEAGKKYEETYNYYYGIGKNPDKTNSLWLFSRNPRGNESSKELERSIAQSELSAYEGIFQQDLNGDGIVNNITRTVELSGQTSLLVSLDGYIIDYQGNKIYLKTSDGAVINAQKFDGFPIGVEKTATGFQLVRLRNGANFELLEIDTTGRIQNSRFLNASEYSQYASFLQQPLELGSSITLEEDTTAVLKLLTNDSAINRDALILASIGKPSFGILIDNKDGTVIYKPNPNYNGTDTFTYNISDGKGETSTVK